MQLALKAEGLRREFIRWGEDRTEPFALSREDRGCFPPVRLLLVGIVASEGKQRSDFIGSHDCCRRSLFHSMRDVQIEHLLSNWWREATRAKFEHVGLPYCEDMPMLRKGSRMRRLHNKPLVPTRNGEAPLLAAQRRR